MALFVILSKVSCEVSAFGKDEVAYTSSKTHGKEQPTVERHHYQHQYVPIANLDNMESTLKNVYTQTQTVVTNTAQCHVCVYVCIPRVCVYVYARVCVGERERSHTDTIIVIVRC